MVLSSLHVGSLCCFAAACPSRHLAAERFTAPFFHAAEQAFRHVLAKAGWTVCFVVLHSLSVACRSRDTANIHSVQHVDCLMRTSDEARELRHFHSANVSFNPLALALRITPIDIAKIRVGGGNRTGIVIVIT
jgi:hypothetical protein